MKYKILATGRMAPRIHPGKLLRILAILVAAPVILYYLGARGLIYFRYNRAVYTDYFWYRAPFLMIHVICGITCTVIGPFQLTPRFRARYPALHRKLGKIYLAGIILSSLDSFYLDSTSHLGLTYAAGLGMLGVVWLTTAVFAYLAIRSGRPDIHREWMIISYVLTLAFVIFRFFEDVMAKMEIGSFAERKVLMSWACWAVPFFLTVLVLQAGKLKRKKTT